MSRPRHPRHAARRPRLPVALAVASLAALGGGCAGGGAEPTPPSEAVERPALNVVVVMTDDQALDTMGAMPLTRRLIGERGTSFDHAFVSFPLCCPSRATFLTGQYAHNHGVRDNAGPRGGYQRLDRDHTLPVWLSNAGYRTAFVGKFLNGYGAGKAVREVPPGWSEWYGLPAANKQRAFDFDLNENGEVVHYGGEPGRPDPYKTNVLADKAVGFVRRAAASRRPFFLWVATNGPHRDTSLPEDAARNPEPAPRDRGRFDRWQAPRRAGVNEGDVSDKPRDIRRRPRLDRAARQRLDREYVSQLESLASIDRLVGRLVRLVRAAGELDRTLLVFTSDNGFLRGQHRLEGKSRPYEESIRVPLLVRGPGFADGAHDRRLVVNVDLAATILDAAGTSADTTLDGRSLRPGADRRRPRHEVLLEVFERKHAFTGLRTRHYTYIEYEGGARELYDLRRDPQQLDNLAGRPDLAGLRARLARRLAGLRNCVGASDCS